MRTTRPFEFWQSVVYAWRAAVAHYRFARRDPNYDAITSLVVTPGRPTQYRMDTAGIRWSDWSRICGNQPVDPAVIWDDVATLWAAYHRKGDLVSR